MCDASGMFNVDMLGTDAPLVRPALSEDDQRWQKERQVQAQMTARKRIRKLEPEPLDLGNQQPASPPDQRLKVDVDLVEQLTGSERGSSAVEQRYAKIAASKVARRLPSDLDNIQLVPEKAQPLTLTPLDRQTEQHEIGGMMLTEGTAQARLGKIRHGSALTQDMDVAREVEGDAFEDRAAPLKAPVPTESPISTVSKGQTGNALLVRRRRKKPKKMTESQARVKYNDEEREEVAQSRQRITSLEAKERVAELEAAADLYTTTHEQRQTIDPNDLPQDTLSKYKARDSDESWFLETLRKIDRNEDHHVHRLPPSAENRKFMAAMKDCVPFYDALVRYHVKVNQPLPEVEVYTWEYVSTLLREPIESRGERPCRLAATGACESLQQFGFACRERMHQSEYIKFVNMRLTNPEEAHTALPVVQRLCLPCVLCHVTHEYFKRLHKRQHKDDLTQMPDGTSETYDDTEPICDFQMDVTTEGQYDIWACVGVGDSEYLGLPGPVIAWDRNNYVPESVEIQTISASDRHMVEHEQRLKRAATERREREKANNPGLWDASAWLLKHKTRKATGREMPVAVFRTPAQTPVPGHYQSELPPDPTEGRGERRKPVIRILRQRDECLRFRDGVMPVRIESDSSHQSTPTSCH